MLHIKQITNNILKKHTEVINTTFDKYREITQKVKWLNNENLRLRKDIILQESKYQTKVKLLNNLKEQESVLSSSVSNMTLLQKAVSRLFSNENVEVINDIKAIKLVIKDLVLEIEIITNEIKQMKNVVNKQMEAITFLTPLSVLISEIRKRYNEGTLVRLDFEDAKNSIRMGTINKRKDLLNITNDFIQVNDLCFRYSLEFNKLMYLRELDAMTDIHWHLICKKVFNRFVILTDTQKTDFAYGYTLLWILKLYKGAVLNYNHYYIDEAQELSKFDIKLIRELSNQNSDIVFNLYGDLNQLTNRHSGTSDWSELNDIANFKYFELLENYRNTNQITEYYMTNFNIESIPIGLNGKVVECIDLNVLIYRWLKVDIVDRKVIIIKSFDNKFLQTFINNNSTKIIRSNEMDIDFSKINVIDVTNSKGLEFDSVGVLFEGMSKEEKYISVTRALKELYIIS